MTVYFIVGLLAVLTSPLPILLFKGLIEPDLDQATAGDQAAGGATRGYAELSRQSAAGQDVTEPRP